MTTRSKRLRMMNQTNSIAWIATEKNGQTQVLLMNWKTSNSLGIETSKLRKKMKMRMTMVMMNAMNVVRTGLYAVGRKRISIWTKAWKKSAQTQTWSKEST